ncbi:MAG: PrsW family intramembrane metalloprotease [Ornithinimicrobium sp.]
MDSSVGPTTGPNVTHRPGIRRILLWGMPGTALLVGALVITLVVSQSAGLAGILLAAAVSTTVIGIVVPLFLWVDRLEAEPVRMLWFAFGWGALVATAASIVLSLALTPMLEASGVPPTLAASVVAAPIVEECAKCAGVLLIFVMARREFNGVVDGIVYAGMVAIGFAFVEDILYLARSYELLGQSGLISLFVIRCLFTPFAHPMFTVCFGIGLGLVAHRRTARYAALPVLGFVAAVCAHAVWNAATLTDLWVPWYFLVQFPLFVGFLWMITWARRAEALMIRDHLTTYGLNGWFTPEEVSMLSSPARRRAARRWAKTTLGRQGEKAMRAFQDECSELAIARDHLERGDNPRWWRPREQSLLHTSARHRASLVSATPDG